MTRFILKILLFFSIVAVVDCCAGFLGDYLQSHAKGGETKRLNDFVTKDNHDIVIFGSSRAHHHYDTPFLSDTLGMDVYNAGYDGNGAILAYGLLELILERYTPKLIIYDIEPSFDIAIYKPDNNNKRYIGNLKPYYWHDAIGSIIYDISNEEWFKVHSGLIRYNSNLLTLAMDYKTKRGSYSKGFDPLYGEYTGTLKNLDNETMEIDNVKLNYLEKIIKLSQTKEIPIFVVASPKYCIGETSVLQPVREICKEYDVLFCDYYSKEKYLGHKEWFKEPMHLNDIGSRAFSEDMAVYIMDNYTKIK